MSMIRNKGQAALWRATLAAGLLLEVVFLSTALLSMIWGSSDIPAWQQIAFVAILVWIYIAYLKQRSLDISASVVDEKIKTHSLVENLDAGIILASPDNRILLLNGKAASLSGLSEIESLGKDLAAEVSPPAALILHSDSAGEIEGEFTGQNRAARISVKLLPSRPGAPPHKLVRVSEPRKPVAAPAAHPGETARVLRILDRMVQAVTLPGAQNEASDRAKLALWGKCAMLLLQTQPLAEQIENGTLASAIQRVPIDLSDLLNSILKEFRDLAADYGVKIEGGATLAKVPVSGNFELLQQALRQVFLHGILSSSASGTITVKTAPMGGNIGILVADQGAAPDAGALPQLFRSDYSGMKAVGGRTIRADSPGLLLARGIVEAHGGSMWADLNSPAGIGVSLMLPCAGGPS